MHKITFQCCIFSHPDSVKLHLRDGRTDGQTPWI